MPNGLPSRRDTRVDLLRGFALLTIFIDHIPGNVLGNFTLRNFGFADAAELFVLLAGFSSMMAYGGYFNRLGIGASLRRIGARCVRLYLFQVGLLLATLVLVRLAMRFEGVELPDLMPFVSSGMKGLKHSLALSALPADLNILPLYIMLLAAFPLIYALTRWQPWAALGLSGSLWLATQFHPALNLTNWLDGQGWFFDPFAWQFLFVIGAVGARALSAQGGAVRRVPWLVALCWAYLGGALVVMAPWTTWGTTWGLSEMRLTGVLLPDKTTLSALRLLDVLAIIYLVLASSRMRRLATAPSLLPVVACGKHSLEVFALGTLLSLAGRLLFVSYGTEWEMQLTINGIGFGLLLITGMALEADKMAATAQARAKVLTPA